MLYKRTALARKPEDAIRHDLAQLREEQHVAPDLLLKDPYILDFLGLGDRYLEKDLEDAILCEIEQFLLELGVGFTFVARQKRLQIDDDDFYIDLLFYKRKLERLVAIDMKLSRLIPILGDCTIDAASTPLKKRRLSGVVREASPSEKTASHV